MTGIMLYWLLSRKKSFKDAAEFIRLRKFGSIIWIPLFLALYFGYKLAKKTKAVKPEEADLSKGYAKID
jgi:amino acid permease